MADLSVFVFQCVDTDFHALTLYRSGDNLPGGLCAPGWIYRGRLLLKRQSLETLPLDAVAAMQELRANGLFIQRFTSGIIIFPR
jgi:hypothetical protein